MNRNLGRDEIVLSELALLDLFDIEETTLARLRLDEGFPCVRLTRKSRVYLGDDIWRWLKTRAENGSTTPEHG